jgi:hypothetical protein
MESVSFSLKKFNLSVNLKLCQKTQPQFHGHNSMVIKRLRLLALFALLFSLFTPAPLIAAETGLRLVYIGALSGYVKLCG